MDFSKLEMGKTQMNKIVGGNATEELIQKMWDVTPEGGSSTWTNNDDGCFDGVIKYPNGWEMYDIQICKCPSC